MFIPGASQSELLECAHHCGCESTEGSNNVNEVVQGSQSLFDIGQLNQKIMIAKNKLGSLKKVLMVAMFIAVIWTTVFTLLKLRNKQAKKANKESKVELLEGEEKREDSSARMKGNSYIEREEKDTFLVEAEYEKVF